MSLQTRAAEIQRFSDRYRHSRNVEGEVSTLQERREVIESSRHRIEGALQALRAMSATIDDRSTDAGDVDADLARLRRQVQTLIEVPDPLREPNSEEFKVLRAQISATAETLTNAAKDRWREFVESRRPPRVDALVRAFARQQPQVATRLRETAKELSLIIDHTALPNGSQVDRVVDLHRQVSDLQTHLIGEDASAGLVAFIQAAGSPEGAPLDLLTDQVRQEIERFGILDAFRTFLA